IPDDENNKWIPYPQLNESPIAQMDSAFIYTKNILPLYVTSLLKAQETNDYTQADELLKSISNFQHKYGYEVMPTDTHVKYEILYNKYDIFKRLFSYYMFAALLLFVVCIFRIFKDNRSEEHTSELQSRENLVCRLLLEKK